MSFSGVLLVLLETCELGESFATFIIYTCWTFKVKTRFFAFTGLSFSQEIWLDYPKFRTSQRPIRLKDGVEMWLPRILSFSLRIHDYILNKNENFFYRWMILQGRDLRHLEYINFLNSPIYHLVRVAMMCFVAV